MAIDVGAIASKRIGPVPVWTIPVVIVGVVGYQAWQSRSGAGTAVEDAATDGDGTASAEDLNPVFTANPVPDQPAGYTTVQVIADNDKWTRDAIAALTATGKYGPSGAATVVQKYLTGDTLSFQERKDIDFVLTKVGLPPDLPENGGTAPKPSTPAGKQGSPPTKHTVRGQYDNTLKELTQLYYGRQDADVIALLYSVNTTIPQAGKAPMPTGTVVTIPRLVTPKYYRATAQINTAYAIAAKNGISVAQLMGLNNKTTFPVKAGTRVRVR